jgi:hypothetical protein
MTSKNIKKGYLKNNNPFLRLFCQSDKSIPGELLSGMAALAYNLKKYLKFVIKKAKSNAIAIKVVGETAFSACFSAFRLIFSRYELPILIIEKY